MSTSCTTYTKYYRYYKNNLTTDQVHGRQIRMAQTLSLQMTDRTLACILGFRGRSWICTMSITDPANDGVALARRSQERLFQWNADSRMNCVVHSRCPLKLIVT